MRNKSERYFFGDGAHIAAVYQSFSGKYKCRLVASINTTRHVFGFGMPILKYQCKILCTGPVPG